VGLETVVVKMSFGRFKGLDLDELPDDYLAWLMALDDLREPLKTAIEREWAARLRSDTAGCTLGITDEVVVLAEAIITAGYRELAKRHHPDHGGGAGKMALVNEAVSALRALLREPTQAAVP
jgi:hypothetical protein